MYLLLAAAAGTRPGAVAVGPDGRLAVLPRVGRLEAMLETTRGLLASAHVQGAAPSLHNQLELARAHQADQGRDASDPHDVAGVYASEPANAGVGQERDLLGWKVVVCGTQALRGDHGGSVPATRLGCTQPLGMRYADQMLVDHWRGPHRRGTGMLARVLASAHHAKDLVLAQPLQRDRGPQLVLFFEPARVVADLEPQQPGLATLKKLRTLVASPAELLELFEGEPRGFQGVFLNSREGRPVAEYRDALVVSYGRPLPTSALEVAATATATATAGATAGATQLQTEVARERLEDAREALEEHREQAAELRRAGERGRAPDLRAWGPQAADLGEGRGDAGALLARDLRLGTARAARAAKARKKHTKLRRARPKKFRDEEGGAKAQHRKKRRAGTHGAAQD